MRRAALTADHFAVFDFQTGFLGKADQFLLIEPQIFMSIRLHGGLVSVFQQAA